MAPKCVCQACAATTSCSIFTAAPYCRAELGELASHAANFKALDVKILAISVDPADKGREVRNRLKAAFPILSDAQQQVMNLYGTRSPEYKNQLGIDINTPTLVLMDKQGIIRWIHQATNFRVRASVEEDLAQARRLAKPPAEPRNSASAPAGGVARHFLLGCPIGRLRDYFPWITASIQPSMPRSNWAAAGRPFSLPAQSTPTGWRSPATACAPP